MVSKISISESSDSEDENLAKLREAADTELINDRMFEQSGKQTEKCEVGPSLCSNQKSNRNVVHDNNHIDDLLIPVEVQKFVSKKLSKIIENQVEFVDVSTSDLNLHPLNMKEERIRLLDDVVLQIDWNRCDKRTQSKRKKLEIRKRIVSDVDSFKSKSMKLEEAAIDLATIAKEVKNWKSKPKGDLFEYREANGRFSLVERETEFSEKKRKNNWNESKIAINKIIY